MTKQRYEEKNERIRIAFLALKREQPERLRERLNLPCRSPRIVDRSFGSR